MLHRLCVFCGSSEGDDPIFLSEARALGALLASRRIGVVYGGASVGVMGAVADGALTHGGEVIGVIPRALARKEIAHHGLTALHVVESMHERKAKMAELSDGFVALPGGLGTLEELFEVWTWAQLGFHHKPCAVLNTAGYYDGLITFLDAAVARRFVRPVHRQMLIVAVSGAELLDALGRYQPPPVPTWLGPGES